MRTYVCLVLLALAACKVEPTPGVCCLTNDDCARLGGIQPRGCPDGFACRNLICEAADCAAAADCPAEQPVCDPGAATCARCTASTDCDGRADAPVCDADTGGCRACVLDAECASEVCDVDTGRCVAEADVIYASANGADTAGCTHSRPCSLSRAVVVATADPSSSLVRLLPGTYGTEIEVSSGTVTFVGTGAVIPPLPGGMGAVHVKSGANVTLRGVTLDLSLNNNILCDGTAARTTLILQDLSIMAFQAGAIFTNCNASMRRVEMTATNGALVSVGNDSTLDVDRVLFTRVSLSADDKRMTVRITNSVFDGGLVAFVPSDDTLGESRMELAFNTLFSRTATALTCGTPLANALVENNVLVAGGPDAVYGSCTTVRNNVVFPQSALLPASNRVSDPLLVNPAGHDLRLGAGSPAIDEAVPSETLNAAQDFFGTPRPQGPRPDIGAHERIP